MRSERQAELVPAIIRLEQVGREVAAAVAGGRMVIEPVLKRIEEQPGRQSNTDGLDNALDCCFSAWPDEGAWSDLVDPLGNSFEADRLRQVQSTLGSDMAIVQEWQNRLRALDACAASVRDVDQVDKSGATNGRDSTKETFKSAEAKGISPQI